MNKILFYVRYKSFSLLCTVICILTVAVTPHSSDIFFTGAYTSLHPMHELSQLRYQNGDQYVSLIPKRDPAITNFPIPNFRIPGLQSLFSRPTSSSTVVAFSSVRGYVHASVCRSHACGRCFLLTKFFK